MPDLGTPSPTCGDVIDCYARHCRANGVHGPQAAKERAHTFALFKAALGHVPVAAAKPYMLADFIDGHAEWRSPATRRQKCSAIKAAFQWALGQERIDRNPFKAVRYGEAERRPELPDAMLAVLCEYASKPVERVLRFLRLTACRLGELCDATWPDVDLARGVWVVRKHKSVRYTHRPKVIALVPDAVALLRSLPVTRTAAILFPATPGEAVPAPQVAGHVFTNSYGAPWTPQVLGNTFRRLKARLGIDTKGASLHGIRHRAITAMIEATGEVKTASQQAGHASTVITERYYWHPGEQFIETMRRAAAKGAPKAG